MLTHFGASVFIAKDGTIQQLPRNETTTRLYLLTDVEFVSAGLFVKTPRGAPESRCVFLDHNKRIFDTKLAASLG